MIRFHYSKNDLVQILIDRIQNTIVLSVNDYPLHPPVRLDGQKLDVNNLKFFVETFNQGTKLEFVVWISYKLIFIHFYREKPIRNFPREETA